MKFKTPPVLHPLLFAIFPVFFLYTKNISELYFQDVIAPLAFVLVVTLSLWVVLNIFFKSWPKSGMVISCIVLFMFSYRHLMEKLISMFSLDMNTHAPVLILSWFTLLEVVLFGIFMIKKNLVQWTKILNLVALCLIVLNGVNILSFKLQSDSPSDNKNVLAIEDYQNLPSAASNLPNIFYLVFDGHIGSAGLKELGRNNDWFISALEERGFFVAQDSYSNYIHTPMSLASSLNYTYLDHLSVQLEQTGPHLTDLKKLYPLLDSNRVFRFLKRIDYETIHCPTDTIFFFHDIKSADVVINKSHRIWNGISLELIRNTPFFKVKWVLFNLHRNRILGAIEQIKGMKHHQKPFILFAHVLCPHFPAVFDKSGNPLDSATHKKALSSFSAKIEHYLPQMEYIDKQILDIIDTLQDSPNPPIIIIQGDHGIRDLVENRKQITEPKYAQVAFSILNAYYLPGCNNSELYEEISPVNSFRIIFNHYFGANLEILPDRSFFCSKESSYVFQDVTDFLAEEPKDISVTDSTGK